jgi:uncharacterized protein (UPF0303 family)
VSTALPEFSLDELEAQPVFDVASFDRKDAFVLGTIAGDLIVELNLSLAVDIVLGDELVYRARFRETSSGNDEWLAGKAAVATHFSAPSLLVRRRQEATGVPFTDLDLDHDRLKAHGGAIPIFVSGELAGTITMSGEPDVVDHATGAEAVARYRATLR